MKVHSIALAQRNWSAQSCRVSMRGYPMTIIRPVPGLAQQDVSGGQVWR
jgi:carbohydrate-binding DOMON domain-containing protein